MAINLELKARLDSCEHAREIALGIGAAFSGILVQQDTYYRVSRGRLKLRKFGGGEAELIYYERPETDLERWSRYEKESIRDGEGLHRILALALGILVVVEKDRLLYMYRGARIHLDEVEGLGSFIEFEVPEGALGGAEPLMRELRAFFGITEADVIKSSYTNLMLEKSIFGEP